MQRFWRSVVWRVLCWRSLCGLCLGVAQAGGAGPPPAQSPTSRTVPVIIANFSPSLPAPDPSAQDGPFACADGQAVFAELTPSGLRLTRRGEVFNLPELAQPGGYGENGVSWVRTGRATGELTLGRTQPLRCRLPASAEVVRVQFRVSAARHYRCAADVELLTSLLESAGQPLAVVQQRRRSHPLAITPMLPQVRSASGTSYQSSEWTWFSEGREGVLEYRGKKVAQGCRLD